jgi:hypothetical protein
MLLRKYLDLRILFYRTRNEHDLQRINADTARLQAEMWSAVQDPGVAQPSPVIALAVAGMNDVFELAGIHPGGMVESHSRVGLELDDNDHHLPQSFGRVWCA